MIIGHCAIDIDSDVKNCGVIMLTCSRPCTRCSMMPRYCIMLPAVTPPGPSISMISALSQPAAAKRVPTCQCIELHLIKLQSETKTFFNPGSEGVIEFKSSVSFQCSMHQELEDCPWRVWALQTRILQASLRILISFGAERWKEVVHG